jgi:hypothetical protein
MSANSAARFPTNETLRTESWQCKHYIRFEGIPLQMNLTPVSTLTFDLYAGQTAANSELQVGGCDPSRR